MKKYRFIAILITVTLLCSAAAQPVLASGEENPSKEETVYVLADANGNAEKIIVSDHFSNVPAEEAEIYMSDLAEVQNVKGEDYWQGISEGTRNLPVNISVTCTLDGMAVDAARLQGVSGHLVLRYEFENTLQTETPDGEILYAPLMVLTGTILDGNTAEQVEVTNGQLTAYGDRNLILGFAFPGLREDLQMDLTEDLQEDWTEVLDIPDYVEISADVEDYESADLYVVVSNALFREVDSSSVEDLFEDTEWKEDLDTLTDAMAQLTDGSSELSDGLKDLQDGCGDLSDGVSQLSDGLAALDTHSEELNQGAEQIFETLLLAAQDQIKAAGLEVEDLTTETYETTLDDLLEYLDGADELARQTAMNQVEASVNDHEEDVKEAVVQAVQEEVTRQVTAVVQEEVTAKVLAAVREQVRVQVLASQGLEEDGYEQALAAGLIGEEQQNALQAAVDTQMETEEVQALLDAAVQEQMRTEEIQTAITSNTEVQMQTEEVLNTIDQNVKEQKAALVEENYASGEVQSQIAAAVQQAADGKIRITELKDQLAAFLAFYDGLAEYTGGVADAAEGASALNGNMPDLISGVNELADGAQELADGLTEFQEEGVQKLTDFIDQDLPRVKDRLKEIIDLAESNTSFTTAAEELDSTVKYIFKLS
ncbi:MAG: hypothetical protein IJ106_07455 [Parasporobacterium sp.]|nr:hypothetical protein [Parasporobacterium sp.]